MIDVRATFGIQLGMCSICLQEDIEDPKIWSCGHGLCEGCSDGMFVRRTPDPPVVDQEYLDYEAAFDLDGDSDFDPYLDYEHFAGQVQPIDIPEPAQEDRPDPEPTPEEDLP